MPSIWAQVPGATDTAGDYDARWPDTEHDDWCGEHEPREPRP